jgi:hypothetical protein
MLVGESALVVGGLRSKLIPPGGPKVIPTAPCQYTELTGGAWLGVVEAVADGGEVLDEPGAALCPLPVRSNKAIPRASIISTTQAATRSLRSAALAAPVESPATIPAVPTAKATQSPTVT